MTATSQPTALSELMRLREARQEPPAVLLVDYHLDDGETGLEVISALRAETGEQIPAIVLTADHSEEVTAGVLRAGHAILRKPVRPAALRALINRVLIRRDVA